jgi:conjugative transfer pilus assembly protein TraH
VLANSVSHDMQRFFKSVQAAHNVTRPQIYHDQAGGYYTGGSLYVRGRVDHTSLASLQLPSVKAGCGGIDLFTGGFGFVNADELKASLRNIANNSVNYAFMLAIDAVTPMIANEMHALQQWANDINRMNIQSCESAAALVGSVWPKTDLAKRTVCQTLGTSSNQFSDHTAARMGCGNPKEYQQIMTDLQAKPEFANVVMINTNIAWEAIKKSGLATGNTALAAWLQSLSGTVIWQETEESARYQVLPSLIADPNQIKALLYGGELRVYQCDESDHCLAPTEKTITVDVKDSLFALVRKTIQSLYGNVVNDTALTDAEKTLLQTTALPLLKMLSVEAAYTQGRQLMQVDLYAEVLAFDLLEQYLHDSVAWVTQLSQQLLMREEERAAFDKGIVQAEMALSRFKASTGQSLWKTTQLVTRSQVMEKYVWGQLSGDVKEALF